MILVQEETGSRTKIVDIRVQKIIFKTFIFFIINVTIQSLTDKYTSAIFFNSLKINFDLEIESLEFWIYLIKSIVLASMSCYLRV